MLHLHPFAKDDDFLPPLPPGKMVVEVLSDFLRYLNNCAQEYIQEVHPVTGTEIWSSQEIQYILTHSNGWEGPQQASMRQAAQEAGLVKPDGGNQLCLIAEGEAGLHLCIERGLMNDSIRVSHTATFIAEKRKSLCLNRKVVVPQLSTLVIVP